MSDQSELELLGLLKSKFPHKIIKYDDQIGYKFNSIQVSFEKDRTSFKFMDNEICIMECNTDSTLQIGDTLSLEADGAVKFKFSLC